MLALTKPEYFIPIHGEVRHLYQHADLACEMGVRPENIFVSEIGCVIEFTPSGARMNSSVPCGSLLIDGLGIGVIGNVVLKDRRLLSKDGLFTVIIALGKTTGELMAEPEILSRGFVYVRGSEELISEALMIVESAAARFAQSDRSEWAQIKNAIKNELKDYLYMKTKRTPMILPIIIEIDDKWREQAHEK